MRIAQRATEKTPLQQSHSLVTPDLFTATLCIPLACIQTQWSPQHRTKKTASPSTISQHIRVLHARTSGRFNSLAHQTSLPRFDPLHGESIVRLIGPWVYGIRTVVRIVAHSASSLFHHASLFTLQLLDDPSSPTPRFHLCFL